MFVLNSHITIGAFSFSSIHSVRIRRSIHSYVDMAVITLPSVCRIMKNGKKTAERLTTGNQFNDGDPVTIALGYNGAMNEEFRGFVKRRDLNMPLQIACEGYSYQLRRNSVSLTGNETVKEMARIAVSGINDLYPVSAVCSIDDQLTGLAVNDKTGADLIDLIKKASGGSITSFFIKPDTLWVGLPDTPYANGTDPFNSAVVNYTPGINTKDNSLRPRTVNDSPTAVTFGRRLTTGEQVWTTSELKQSGAKFQQILNHAGSKIFLQTLANEKEFQLNYKGYEGKLTGFLQPFVLPGYTAFITDSRYPELKGNYLVESTDVVFGQHGARRIVEVGPQLGWAKK